MMSPRKTPQFQIFELLKASAILLALIASPLALGSNGVDRGGGQGVVDTDGSVHLRDMVDQAVCNWITGEEFRNGLAQFDTVLKPLRGAAPGFWASLYGESGTLNICMLTGKLKSLPAEEQDGLTIFSQGLEQIAVRYGDEVYINQAYFGRMSEKEKALLYLHELMHSRIDQSVSGRMTKLRSFVNSVGAKMGGSFSETELKRLAERNGVDLSDRGELTDLPAQAAAEGNLTLLKKLLRLGFSAETSLQAALKAEQSEAASYLIQKGVPLEFKNPEDGYNDNVFSALAQAARNGDAALIRLLVSRGAGIQTGFPLLQAVRSGSLEATRVLMELKGSEFTSEQVHFAILQAIARKNGGDQILPEGEKLCLSSSSFSARYSDCYAQEYPDYDHPTPQKPNEGKEILTYLLSLNRTELDRQPKGQLKSDVTGYRMDEWSPTALSLCVRYLDEESLNQVLTSGAIKSVGTEVRFALSALRINARYYGGNDKQFQFIESLMKNPLLQSPEISWELLVGNFGLREHSASVLGSLIESGNYELAERVARLKGINPNQKDSQGKFVLETAIEDAHAPVSLAQALIDAGAGVSTDENETTNFILSSIYTIEKSDANGGRRDQIYSRMVAQPSFQAAAHWSYNWATALHIAASKNLTLTLKALLARPDVDVNAVEKNDTTPLMLAAESGNVEAIRLLLAAPGIDVNAKNKEGKTALELGYCNAQVQTLLRDAGGHVPFFHLSPSCQ